MRGGRRRGLFLVEEMPKRYGDREEEKKKKKRMEKSKRADDEGGAEIASRKGEGERRLP